MVMYSLHTATPTVRAAHIRRIRRDCSSRTTERSAFAGAPSGRNLHKARLLLQGSRDIRIQLGPKALRVGALCGIWSNSKFFLLARSRRADRVGQQATQRAA